MHSALMERRALELMIRRAEAEEHQLERRLDRLEHDLWRTRRSLQALAGDQPWRGYA